MAVVKIRKKECNYVQIEKLTIDESRLSWGATGLLAYLVGRPDNWVINITHLSGVKTDKRDATRGMLNELRKFNYCHYFEIREKGKIVETTYLVFETPTTIEEAMELIEAEEGQTALHKPYVDKTTIKSDIEPLTGKPFTAQPFTENPTLLIKEYTNKEITNKRTTTTGKKKESEKIRSSLEFLNEKEFEKINAPTKANITKTFPDLTREQLVNIYALVEKEVISGTAKDFNAVLFKALKGEWTFKAATENRGSRKDPKEAAIKLLKTQLNYITDMAVACSWDAEYAVKSFQEAVASCDKSLISEYSEKLRNSLYSGGVK